MWDGAWIDYHYEFSIADIDNDSDESRIGEGNHVLGGDDDDHDTLYGCKSRRKGFVRPDPSRSITFSDELARVTTRSDDRASVMTAPRVDRIAKGSVQ